MCIRDRAGLRHPSRFPSSLPAGRVRGRVRATELDIDHPLAPVGVESLGAILHTDLMSDVFVCEIDGLVPQAAYGVYADLLHLCRNR